jgi:predicted transcriptional regulator
MDIPLEVINAVSPQSTQEQSKKLAKKRAPYVKKLSKRILHAIGNGLRTSTSIANALNVPKTKIHSNLAHMKVRGLVYSHKQNGSNEHKYHLTTEKPVLGTTDLTKKKARKPYKARAPKIVAEVPTIRRETKEEVELNHQLDRMMQRLNTLELSLVEKEKEVWTLECEVFDKKAIIKYLEEKLFQLGVRV